MTWRKGFAIKLFGIQGVHVCQICISRLPCDCPVG